MIWRHLSEARSQRNTLGYPSVTCLRNALAISSRYSPFDCIVTAWTIPLPPLHSATFDPAEMPAPKLIVTVCTANICRSPMAEALLRHALQAEPEPLRSCEVVSAGVAARKGEKISPNSVEALAKVGLRASDHRSQPLTQTLADRADLVLCMTESHRAVIQLALTPPPKNVRLWREFMPGPVDKEIGDPFGGPLREYEACRDEMVEALPSILAYLRGLQDK